MAAVGHREGSLGARSQLRKRAGRWGAGGPLVQFVDFECHLLARRLSAGTQGLEPGKGSSMFAPDPGAPSMEQSRRNHEERCHSHD